MKPLLATLICLIPFLSFAQQRTQTVKGSVIDKTTRQPLIGATVAILNTSPSIGTTTDENGEFQLENVPIGRHNIECQYIGYQSFLSEGTIVTSTKEVVLNIEMLEGAIEIDEVLVKAIRNPNEPVNELAVVSTRSFSVEETERIAASVNDPGRMALAYPGVQQGGDDNENDIIIRGNSSFGMLWRLEGIDIPNPNHFARPGTSGGGITVFSAQLLGRSDFSTGGMAAEYGNAISGAMDVHFRKGNMEKREFRTKIGLLGLDFATEGPIQKGRSSYLINYRYSTLSLLNRAGFHLVGERVDNDFQDLSFNLAFNGKDKKSFVTVFGLGGLSLEHYHPVANPEEREAGRADHWEDRVRPSNMGAIGVTYTRLLDEKSFLKVVVAGMGSDIYREYDTLSTSDVRFRYNTEKYLDKRISSSITYSRKMSNQLRLKTGLMNHFINYEYFKETAPRNAVDDVNINDVRNVSLEGQGNTQTLQYYAQFSYKANEKLTINAGGHFLHLFLNNTSALEPRFSMRYQISPRQNVSLAYGLHSQLLPLATYFFTQKDTINGVPTLTFPNHDLKPIQSNHLILGYNFYTKKGLRIGAETYMQRLNRVPVRADGKDDNYWLLNDQTAVREFPLAGDGKGLNYGIDLAVEQFFSNRVYFLLTYSRFEALSELANGRRVNTRFATKFASTFTLGKEFEFKKGSILQIGARVMYNGGFRYTPYDPIASGIENRYVADLTQLWEGQVEPYFRIDSRIAWRFNKKNVAGNLSLDIQNILDRRNTRSVAYNSERNTTFFRTHSSGFIPVLSYQMDF